MALFAEGLQGWVRDKFPFLCKLREQVVAGLSPVISTSIYNERPSRGRSPFFCPPVHICSKPNLSLTIWTFKEWQIGGQGRGFLSRASPVRSVSVWSVDRGQLRLISLRCPCFSNWGCLNNLKDVYEVFTIQHLLCYWTLALQTTISSRKNLERITHLLCNIEPDLIGLFRLIC